MFCDAVVEVRGQFSVIGSLLPPCEFWGTNSGRQAWWQVSILGHLDVSHPLCLLLNGACLFILKL